VVGMGMRQESSQDVLYIPLPMVNGDIASFADVYADTSHHRLALKGLLVAAKVLLHQEICFLSSVETKRWVT
jgi:hypothetical protein